MRDHNMTERPVCTWVTVTDEAGRTHMEACWTRASATGFAASAA